MERMRRRGRVGGEKTPEETQRSPGNGAAGSVVQVIWGASADAFELAGLTVGEAYRLLSAPLHIAAGVAALVNGVAAPEGHRLSAGDVLEFARPAGEKGARP